MSRDQVKLLAIDWGEQISAEAFCKSIIQSRVELREKCGPRREISRYRSFRGFRQNQCPISRAATEVERLAATFIRTQPHKPKRSSVAPRNHSDHDRRSHS